jgi:iron complex transport system substrate-binding protein
MVDIEKLVSLEPDLILADSIHKANVIPALEKLGIAVLTIDPPSLDNILKDIELIGRVTGQTAQTASLSTALRERIQAVSDSTALLAEDEKPRTFFLSWHDPIWTAGTETLINDLVTRAGGANIAADLKGHSQMDLESIIQRNPQVILVLGSMGDQNTSYNYVKNEARFQAADALKNNRVHILEPDVFSRNTQRTVDARKMLLNYSSGTFK